MINLNLKEDAIINRYYTNVRIFLAIDAQSH